MIVPYSTSSREEVKSALSKNFGIRLAQAREACGMSQIEAAATLGFSNSSRLSKIELSSCGSLKDMWLVPVAVRVFDVSADFLLGLSDCPQREVKQARKSQIEKILADSIANELAEIRGIAKALDEIAESVQKIEGKTRETVQTLVRFEELNPEFSEMSNGAKLARLIHQLRGDAKQSSDKLADIRQSLKAKP